METNTRSDNLYEKLSPIELEKVAQRVAQGFTTAAIAGEFKAYTHEVEALIAREEMKARIDLWRWNVDASPIERLVHAEEERYFAVIRAVNHDRPGAIATANRFIAELRTLIDQTGPRKPGREIAHRFAHLGPATPPPVPPRPSTLDETHTLSSDSGEKAEAAHEAQGKARTQTTLPAVAGHVSDHVSARCETQADAQAASDGPSEDSAAEVHDEESSDRSGAEDHIHPSSPGTRPPPDPGEAAASASDHGNHARKAATKLPRHFVSLPKAAAEEEPCPRSAGLIDPAWPIPGDPLVDPATILDPLLRQAAAMGMRGRVPVAAGDDELLKPLGGRKPESEEESMLVLRNWLGPLGLKALRMIEDMGLWDGLEHIVVRDAEAAFDDGTRFELEPEERAICARADAAFESWSCWLNRNRPEGLNAGANDNVPPRAVPALPAAGPAPDQPGDEPARHGREEHEPAQGVDERLAGTDGGPAGPDHPPGPARASDPDGAPGDPKIWAREPVPRHLRPGR